VGNSRAMTAAQKHLMRMARVLGAPLRIQIMVALSVRPMSPKMLLGELGEGELSFSRVDENLKELKRYGWVELAGTKSGGAPPSTSTALPNCPYSTAPPGPHFPGRCAKWSAGGSSPPWSGA
jgi:hypothetical protein